jgi:excisionase family DNA binding protein
MIGGSNKMLTAEQTAEFLGVSLTTLYRQWKAWGLRGYRVGHGLKFRERDIESWLERQAA